MRIEILTVGTPGHGMGSRLFAEPSRGRGHPALFAFRGEVFGKVA